MKPPEELPAELRNKAFDVTPARSGGLSAGRLRRRDLRRPFYGVRAPAVGAIVDATSTAPRTDAEKWAALLGAARILPREYAARMPNDQFFSHVTAAIIHGLPLPHLLLTRQQVDVATTERARRRSGRNVSGHFVAAEVSAVVRVGGLAVSSPVSTWCQLATTLTLDQLIIMGDALVRRQQPMATMAGLREAVLHYAGRPGAARLREALAFIRPRTDSPRETLLRLIIVRAGLPEPEVNFRITDRDGAFLAWGDLTYRAYKILIEYDGEGHRENEKQFHRDVDRLDAIMEAGWRVIRFNKNHVGPRQGEIIGRIRRALLERGSVD